MQISIVMPAFNNQEALDRSLRTLEMQVRRHALECIVVDDGSAKPLTVPSWCKLHRIERNPVSRGSSAAKNTGAAMAEGDTLVFIDSDILCLRDTLLALQRTMHEFESLADVPFLLNVMRVDLPPNYPKSRMGDMERLLRRCRSAGILNDEKMTMPIVCWEQNVGMIRRDAFERIGGYDADAFRNWGLNNQDLCLRVFKDGGRVSSAIKRTVNNNRLYCFHPWHASVRSKWHRDLEFEEKWGEKWSDEMARRFYKEALSERNSQGHSVQVG